MAQNEQAECNRQPDSDRLAQLKLDALLFLLIVTAGMLIAMLQNPSNQLPRTTLFFDSSHYLESAKRLYETTGLFAQGKLSLAALDSLAFYIMLDGPILPGAGAILFTLMGKAPSLTDWQTLVNLQCLFHGLCTGFVFLLSKNLLKTRRSAIVAAALWTLYPPAISACNSFLTEPLSALLTVALLFFLFQNDDWGFLEGAKSLFSGLCLATLCLLKPALAPAAASACIVSWTSAIYKAVIATSPSKPIKRIMNKQVLLRPAIALVGVAVVMLPWLSFTYAVQGKFVIIPSRRPVYNIATGCNLEADGWGCHPQHPAALMYDDNEEALPVALALIESRPPEIVNLTLRKITRIWNLPWNDYRYKILGLNFRAQAIFHLLLLILGTGGAILLGASVFSARLNRAQKLSVACILIFLAGHFIFLPFEGIGRYAFTAMPLLIITAVYLIRELLKHRTEKRLLSSLLILLALLVIQIKFDCIPIYLFLLERPESALFLSSAMRFVNLVLLSIVFFKLQKFERQEKSARLILLTALTLACIGTLAINSAFALSSSEAVRWQTTLRENEEAQRIVKVVSDKPWQKPDWVLLLVDGDSRSEDAIYSINNSILNGRAVSLYQFYTEKYELEDWMNQFASLIHRTPQALARWRAIEVPVDLIKPEAENIISCRPGKEGAATIYGDYIKRTRDGRLLLPSASEASPGKFFNDSEDAFDSRIMQSTNSRPAAFSHSEWLRNGKHMDKDLSRSFGIQKGDYRLYLLFGYKHTAGKREPTPPETKASIFSKDIVSTPLQLSANLNHSPYRFEIELPASLLTGTHLKICITGKGKAKNSSSEISVAGVVDNKERFMASVLPGTPRLIPLAAESDCFSVASELPVLTIDKKSPKLRIELSGHSADSEISELSLRIEAEEKPNFKGHSIKVF